MHIVDEHELEFNRLASEWDRETGHHSNPAIIQRHENYSKLIAYGRAAVPWLLRRIARGNIRLEYSKMLCVLTGERPGYEPDRECNGLMLAFNVRAFADAWLQWGREHGYDAECQPQAGRNR